MRTRMFRASLVTVAVLVALVLLVSVGYGQC